MTLNQFSRTLYKAGKVTRNVRAVQRAVQTGSIAPIGKRLARIALGRGLGKAERKISL